MDTFGNYKEDSEVNTSNVSAINCPLKKKHVNEHKKNFSEIKLPNSSSDIKDKNGVNSDGSYDESEDAGTFLEAHSPTYISKKYEPLSSSAEDSLNSFIDTKSSEFNKNLLETDSCDENIENLKERKENEIDSSSHELRQSTSSLCAAILNKGVKRKCTEECDDEVGSKYSQDMEKIYKRHFREKILKFDSNIAERSDDFKTVVDINTEQNIAQDFDDLQGQDSNMYSLSQKIQSNPEDQEKPTSFQSIIKLMSRNMLNNLEKTMTSSISEQPLDRNKLKLIQSPERILNKDNPISPSGYNKSAGAASPPTSHGSETPNRLSIDTDEMIPIQAEVVMSDASENDQFVDKYKHASDKAPGRAKEKVEDYLNSFINCTQKGNIVEYPPLYNEVPKDCSDFSTWQLEKVSLPPFKPFLDPPSWVRLTIPPEGYKCNSCGDVFFIESSLVQHKERRSVWITFDCSPCDAKLSFYNKCAFKCHVENHVRNGEHINDDSVVVKTLPLQLMKLLQPIVVPVPKALQPGKVNKKRSPTKSPSKLSSSQHGKENHPKIENQENLLALVEEFSPQMSGLSTPFDSVVTSKKTFKCYLCEKIFYSVRDLMSHMRTNQSSSDQRVECRKCLLVLPSVCAAKAHILTHPPANSTNISVCPECGSRCDGPREFVHHLNTCGHQYRRSGILCQQCNVSFFKFSDDFISHWIKEHCSKSYECVVCSNTFESLVFHKCSSPGKQVFATFKCLLTCPLCPHVVQLHTQEERETQEKIRAHLNESHPSVINRVYYVYKSKFCTNAFRSKDELRAHHDREHRRDNHYRTKTCTLHHEVLGFQHQYFNGQEPRNAFISLSVALSQEEIDEAQTMDVPTVSSVVDTVLFPQGPMTLETLKMLKAKETTDKSPVKSLRSSSLTLKKKPELVENLRPCICYRCGYTYTSIKDVRRHRRSCEGESSQRLCQICGVAAVGEEFSRHCKIHIDEGLILCMYCNGAPFSSSQILLQHFELHVHQQFSYPAQCPFCSYIMSDITTALLHVQEEHEFISTADSLNVKCDRCHRTFHGERGLSVHLIRCNAGIVSPNNVNSVTNTSISGTSLATKQCLICKKGLSSEIYGKHIIGHLEEGLLVCGMCDGVSFPSSVALLHHLEEHSSNIQLPFPCPVCSYTMSSSYDALTHLKEDHGFGDLTCSGCEMHYNFTYQLQRHIDIVHKVCLYAKRRYICWICRAYDHVKKETLMNHFKNIHGLAKEEVDEKEMIRTRGQGTMPTSQFIPTKPLGSKKLGASKSCSKDKKKKSKSNSNLSRLKKNHKPSTETIPKLSLQNVVLKKEALDIIQNSDAFSFEPLGNPDSVKVKLEPDDLNVTSEVDLLNTKYTNNPPVEKTKAVLPKISIKINKNNLPKAKDKKLRDRTRVLIKRLPESALRSKSIENNFKNKTSIGIKLKKRKAFRCDRCSYGTNNKEKIEYHKSKHENNGTDGFLCSVCGQSFVVEPSLKRHMFFAHKIKQKPQALNKSREYRVEISNSGGKVSNSNKNFTKKNNSKSTKSRQVKIVDVSKKNTKKTNLQTNPDYRQRITIKIKSTPVGLEKNDAEKEKIDKKEVEEENDEEMTNSLQCSVCKEVFLNSILLYSHIRTHGMAFLKHGRKKRPFVQDKAAVQC